MPYIIAKRAVFVSAGAIAETSKISSPESFDTMLPFPVNREPSVVVPKSTPNVRNRSVHAKCYLNRAESMPSDAFAEKKAVALAKASRRCTIRQVHQAKPDPDEFSATAGGVDAGLESFFAAVPLRRVTGDIPRLSEVYPKYDFEANLWPKGANST